MANNDKLIEAAIILRGEAPQAWANFVSAMREYAASTNIDMLRCPPEHLTRAQGMALQANEIAQTLNDAPKLYDKIRDNRVPKHGR